MPQSRSKKLVLSLNILVVAVAALYIAAYVIVALLRISYPFEFEWMEGSSVDHVARVLAGQPLYVSPTVDFVPSIYPPLYYYVSAIAAALTGIGFLPLRLVSFLASLGCMVLLFAFVWRESKDRFAAFLAAGLFAATFHLSGSWFDLARVDSLFLFFLLAAFYVLRFYRSRIGGITAATLLTLACFTKQTAFLAGIFFLIYAAKARKEHGLYFAVSFVLLVSLSVLLLNLTSNGWFSFYAFQVPASHNIIGENIYRFWLFDLTKPLPIVCLFAIIFFKLASQKDRWFFALTAAGFIAAAYLPRVKDGNYLNDLMPAYAFLALLAGPAVPALRASLRKTWVMISASCALLIQLVMLYYSPSAQLPSAADRAAGTALIRSMEKYAGDVWVTSHGYVSSMAGKHSHASAMPIYDVLHAKDERISKLLLDDFEAALRAHRFAAVIVDNDHFLDIDQSPDYVRKAGVFPDPKVFFPVTGTATRPLRVYVPRP